MANNFVRIYLQNNGWSRLDVKTILWAWLMAAIFLMSFVEAQELLSDVLHLAGVEMLCRWQGLQAWFDQDSKTLR